MSNQESGRQFSDDTPWTVYLSGEIHTDWRDRIAAGAAEALAYFEVGNLARVLEMLKDRRIRVAGTALNERSQSLFDFQPDAALAVVMGAEGEGLRRLTLERCDDLIAIPMAGDVQSLNVSVATGVVLFHVRAALAR